MLLNTTNKNTLQWLRLLECLRGPSGLSTWYIRNEQQYKIYNQISLKRETERQHNSTTSVTVFLLGFSHKFSLTHADQSNCIITVHTPTNLTIHPLPFPLDNMFLSSFFNSYTSHTRKLLADLLFSAFCNSNTNMTLPETTDRDTYRRSYLQCRWISRICHEAAGWKRQYRFWKQEMQLARA